MTRFGNLVNRPLEQIGGLLLQMRLVYSFISGEVYVDVYNMGKSLQRWWTCTKLCSCTCSSIEIS